MRRNIFRLGGALALGTALSLGLAACGGGSGDGSSGGGEAAGTVKVGFLGALTGENAGIAIPPHNGAKLAFDEYNKTNPKTKIEYVPYDSQGLPEQATPLATKAVREDKIVAMVGPAFSGESKNVGPILEEAKVPSVSASATAVDLAQQGWKYWHRVVANDGAQGPAAAEFLTRAMKAKKIFIVDDSQEYSAGLADAVDATLKGKATVNRDKVDQQGSDYASTVNKIKAFNPDAVFFGGYYAQAGRLLKQLRQADVQAPFMSGDGSLDAGLIEGAGEANATDTYIACPCVLGSASDDPEVKDFAQRYKAAFNADAQIYATEGYDAATAIIDAIKAGNTDAEKINEFLKTYSKKGVSKDIKFAPNGELSTSSIFVYAVKGKDYTLLGDSKTASVQ
ncbi:MAG: ABC transporter substrate-binding protein [Streptosporangiales bacterium]|nr:ABC transporter substrate-binding protein [Streptosporangiales bacterium]